jgi:acetyl-CoA acyltransferase
MAATVVPMAVFGDGGWTVADRDQFLRPETTLEALADLRTPFREGGRVTAGNSAGLTDGATACFGGFAVELADPHAAGAGCPASQCGRGDHREMAGRRPGRDARIVGSRSQTFGALIMHSY